MDKMTNCKACGKEIAKGANKCVHCGKDQRNFFMRHKIITVLLVLIILGAIGSLGAKKDQPTKVAESTSTNSKSSSNDNKKKEVKVFKIGDVIQLKDYKVIVNKIRTGDGDEINQPKEGHQFLYVDCTVENVSDKEQTVSSIAMFRVQDKDGRSCDQSIASDSKGQLDGTVSSGRKITGEYVVEMPKGATGMELLFDSSLFTGGQVIVKLN